MYLLSLYGKLQNLDVFEIFGSFYEEGSITFKVKFLFGFLLYVMSLVGLVHFLRRDQIRH